MGDPAADERVEAGTRLAALSERWGREKNYSWTITPGQQADIMLVIVKPLLDALAAAREREKTARGALLRISAGEDMLSWAKAVADDALAALAGEDNK